MQSLDVGAVYEYVDLVEQFPLVVVDKALKGKPRVAPDVFSRTAVNLSRQLCEGCRLIHRVAAAEGDTARKRVALNDAHHLADRHVAAATKVPRLRIMATRALMVTAGTIYRRAEPGAVDHCVFYYI